MHTRGPMQSATGLLTAGLDSSGLQAWAISALIPDELAAVGDFLAATPGLPRGPRRCRNDEPPASLVNRTRLLSVLVEDSVVRSDAPPRQH
jgi:hypothetical protein